MRKTILSSYSDSELTFLLDILTKSIEQTREESKKIMDESAKTNLPVNRT
jgi:hypothetical protein